MPQSGLQLIVQVFVCSFYCLPICTLGLWMHHWLIFCAIMKSPHLITNFNQFDDKEMLYLDLKPKYSINLHVAGKFELDWVLQRLPSSGKKKICVLMIQHKREIESLREGMLYVHEIFPYTKGLMWHWCHQELFCLLPCPPTEGSDQSRCSYAHDVKPHTLL